MNKLISELKEKLNIGYSLMEFCEEKGLSYNKTYHIVKKAGVSLPKNGTSRKSKINHISKVKYNIGKDELMKLYYDDKLSIKQISKIYGCSVSIIDKLMNRYGIKFRSKSEASEFQWTPELREHFKKLSNDGVIGVQLLRNRGFKGNTSIEKSFITWCNQNNIIFKQQQQLFKGGHQYDFLLDGTNILVEVDGLYWHNRKHQKEKDQIQVDEAIKLGYNVYRFTDKEIRETKGGCFDRLLQVIWQWANRKEKEYIQRYFKIWFKAKGCKNCHELPREMGLWVVIFKWKECKLLETP